MRKTILFASILASVAGLFTACEKDDTDFSSYINGATDGDSGSTSEVTPIYIVFGETAVSVTGDTNGYVTTSGTEVTVNTGSDTDSLLLVLSGSCPDGSLIVYRQRKYGIVLNGLTLTNSDGPAINNQCGKSLYLRVADGTTNTLADGDTYTEQSYDQKGALFSEGQIYFSGTGTLNVKGNYKHSIACDDYIVFSEATVSAASVAGCGVKANDGIWINSGTLHVSTTADGGRGIRCDSVVVITGGTTTITTSGDCRIETKDGVRDTTSCACIKCDYPFTMTGGQLTMTSTGDGGKGISCDQDITIRGGTFVAKTSGSNDTAKPKAVKSDTAIIVSGGSFTATVKKSWACDNGTDSDAPADHLTILGTPASSSVTKKSVIITY